MERVCSSTSKRSWPKDGFTDLLFSWSLAEILDEDLYKYQVEKIPESFQSVDEYLSSFEYPLLEDTRAALAASLETVYKAPFAEVTLLKERKADTLLYDVKVGSWRNRISDRGKEPYRTLPGDLVLLSDSKPESLSDLQRIGRMYTFASVTKISDDEKGDNCTSVGFKLRTACSIEIGYQQSKPLFVVYLTNMLTNKRIWKALRMRQNLKIIEKVLVKNDLGQSEDNCEFCRQNIHSEIEEKSQSTLSSKLNESQLGAVMASIRKVGCNHRSSVELIWGPPGTGKTSTLSTLLFILLGMNVRTLICAPTNTAITALAARVTALVRNSFKTESGKSFLTCPLGGVLLFGNNDRLKVGSDIQEIFLDYRVDRLMEISAPLTGWRHCLSSMLDFLEDCVSQHRTFVENEKIKSKQHFDGESAHSGFKSFLEFVRDRFTHVASPLRNCMLTVVTHLPRSLINEGTFQTIVQLFSLVDSLEKKLFEDSGMTSEYLETMFLQQVMIGSESFTDSEPLLLTRSQCVFILRSLLDSLSTLILTSKTSNQEFCFQNASLIFCTISSAFKLHSVDMEPFQLLIIDEAAQVKECETSIAFQIKDVRHAILVGDECQLPATVSSKLSEEAGFGRSVFERLSSMGNPKHLLNVQYRMHPSISLFPNSNFYQNQILDGPNVQRESYQRTYLQGKMFGPYTFINIRAGREELDDVGVSRRNMVEVAVIVKLVQKLFNAWNGSKEDLSIGLISPYAAQVAAIHDKLQSRYENLKRFTVKVKSIDGFQGGEEDIIILSTVRSHKGGYIGFLCSPRRTNVALTRARHCLWILGNERSLGQSDSVWQAIVSDAKDRNCFFNADEDCDFAKAIIDVKKELDQLDDLLNGKSIIFNDSRWQVLFGDNFRKSFHTLRFSSTKKLVINLLLKLSKGWRPRKVNVDWKCECSSYIIKQFKVDVYCVVCSIDIMKDSIYKQVLKVWDILPMTDTSKLLKRLDNISSMYTDDFIKHCNDTLFERNLEVPRSWSLSNDIKRFKSLSDPELITGVSASSVENRPYVESSKVSESLLLMKFYSLSSHSVHHLLSDIEGKEVDLPFEVTDEEREIINFPGSSFILGRSGTGKTTILTMKLYLKLQQYCIALQDSMAANDNLRITEEVDVEQNHGGLRGPVLHQLFVTVSPKLCHAVKKNVAQMKSIVTENLSGHNNFIGMDDVDEISEFKDIPDTFVGIQQEKYPLILTFHKFLMMLDGTLGKSYFQRFPSVRDSSHYEGRRSVALQKFLRTNEVTYHRFFSVYWPHFSARLTKSLDCSRVFTEIMSHIKGGSRDGESFNFKRSRQEYISMSESRISTLCPEQRDAIYDIFEDYEKMKLEHGEFDLADFVNDIHLRLSKEDLPGDKMDYVYIDEVQDLTMKQISLFRYICYNVDEGFIFSGDTAQTIARGIDFRFEDIRSLFYNEFLMRSQNCDFTGKKDKGLISDMFNLSHNFRTHTGVLRLAQSVIDLMCYYFPHSIDLLAPETSRIYGESPLVLEPGSDENLIISLFGHSGKWVGFGADQVILVRDDSARQEISSYIGHQALILTIVECKGLEFQDVLLYNFFGSSLLGNQWRVVYEFLNVKDLNGNSVKSFPSFSQSKHNILCSELKQLYVAITRTRQRLWICENDAEVSKPMLDYWRRLALVQVRKIDDSLAETMQRASTPEEWKSQGIKLFWEKNYEMATMCFEKAGEETWEKNAKASGLRAAADSCRSSNSDEANIKLRQAAEIFDSIDRVESAAECFCELGEYESAGRIYRDKCGMSELQKAGECFSLARKHELAAEVYASGNFFGDCLSACVKGNHMDLGLQYIEKWKQQAASDSVIKAKFMEIDSIAQGFLENCARECHQKEDKASMMKFVRAFFSPDSKRNFLKLLDCLEELLNLERELGNFNEAIEIAKSLGDVLLEVDLLEKAGQYANACSLILSYVISNCLWGSGNPGWPLKSFHRKVELLNRAMSIALKVSEPFYASISSQAKFLLYEQKNLSELMHFYNASAQYETPISEILIIRKFLDAHLEVKASKYEWDHELHLEPRLFDQRIARNQVSGGSLVYLWNLWKVKSLEILECLGTLERTNHIVVEGIVAICFNYFGLRLPDDSGVTIHLLSPGAAWVKNVDGFTRRNRNVVALEARHFALAAQKFWLQEFVCVGLRVLDSLHQLHRSGMTKRCQSMCLLHIFDIAKFFLDSKSIDVKHKENRKLQEFVQLCTNYFGFVFPLDPRESLSENMISLRETEISKKLLEESVLRNIGGRRELSSGQIGRAVVTMLGTGWLNHGFYDKISERLASTSSWKQFIETLRAVMKLDSTKESKSSNSIGDDAVSVRPTPITMPVHGISPSQCVQDSSLRCSPEDLKQALHKALEETYNLHWRTFDYISPHCLLYLVERLLILPSHPKGFFFTMKSSFLEYLVSLPSAANPRTGLVTAINSDPSVMVEFVLQVVENCLCNRIETVEWIKRSGINYNSYIPVLLLRLLMILFVLSINWGLSFNIFNQKMSRQDITSHLPRVFLETLRPRRWGFIPFVSAIATAFKGVGDPLVIVTLGGKHNFPYPDAVPLDLGSFSSKMNIMETLFPGNKTEASHDQPAIVERNVIKPNSIVMPPVVSDEGKNTVAQPSYSCSQKGNGTLQMNWDLIGEICEAYEASLINGNIDNLKSLLLKNKLEVEERNISIASAVTRLIEQLSHSDEDEEFANRLIQILSQLLSLLHKSDYDARAMTKMVELFKWLEARRPQLDALLSRLAAPDAELVSGEDGKEEDSAAAPAPSDKGRGGKGKDKKRKKGKGGGKRKCSF